MGWMSLREASVPKFNLPWDFDLESAGKFRPSVSAVHDYGLLSFCLNFPLDILKQHSYPNLFP